MCLSASQRQVVGSSLDCGNVCGWWYFIDVNFDSTQEALQTHPISIQKHLYYRRSCCVSKNTVICMAVVVSSGHKMKDGGQHNKSCLLNYSAVC